MGALLGRFGLMVVRAVLPTLATIVSGFIVELLRVQLKKAKIQMTAEQEKQLAALVERAVLAVEEQARRDPDGRMKGGIKQAAAMNIVLEEMPDLPVDLVRQMIDATLTRVRAEPAI